MNIKRIFLTLVLATTIIFGAHAQKTYALLVGIANYGTADQSNNLTFTVKDVKEMKQLLSQQKNCIVSAVTGKYATPENLKKKIQALCRLATANDNIIFFFSGHGRAGSIVCYGGQSLSYTTLVDYFASAKTRNIFCFIDACHSGSAVGSSSSSNYSNNKGPLFMTACRPEETSIDLPVLNNGIFAQSLIKGMRGMADADKNRQITAIELYKYVYRDVLKKTEQMWRVSMHPQLIGDKALHNIVITRW